MSRIGSVIGVPVYADECTTEQSRVSFARILVHLDITKDTIKEVVVEEPNGKKFKQEVSYEFIPPFCGKCRLVRHVCTDE